MRNKGYTVLGVFVWKTVKFYVKMNYGKYIPSRRQALIVLRAGLLIAHLRAWPRSCTWR